MINQTKLDVLVGLLRRRRITLEDIKDDAYRAAAEALLTQDT